MRRGGIVLTLLVALAGCQSSSEQADVTTTTGPGTTVVEETTTTTSTTAPKKRATTTTTRPKPATTLPTSEGEEEVDVVVQPEHIEPYLLQPASEWRPVRDDVFGTGRMHLDQAVADETDDGDDAGEARKFLEGLGFHSGYSRAWERQRAPDDPSYKATHLLAYLYFFASPAGARAYLDHDAESFEEATGHKAEPVSAGIRGSRAWAGVDEDHQSIAVVLFTFENFYARIVCTDTHDPTGRCRSWATEHADQQHRQLQ